MSYVLCQDKILAILGMPVSQPRSPAGNHVAAFDILFNLICNMSMSWKS